MAPRIPQGARYVWRGRARWVEFPDREAKSAYMQEAAEHDARDPAILAWAEQFRPLPRPARERAILRFVQFAIRYERDPAWYDRAGARHGIELLDSAAVGLQRGYGDCDLKARLFVALCLASGIPARIAPVFRGRWSFPHVRAEVLSLAGEDTSGRELWDVADPTIVNSEIGRLPAHALTELPSEG
jgi:transglutaminase-like putative cysteine protease